MKTAVSLPDKLFEEAEKTAEEMGIPRSRLFARALEEFIERHRRENITERLNRVYSETASDEFEDISDAGLESLRDLTRNDSW
jgi:metal-responsive CopG/Arc/MetJ family transcriptional regulator